MGVQLRQGLGFGRHPQAHLAVDNLGGRDELVDLLAGNVADMIKGKTLEQIRQMFRIANDFTPEEDDEFCRKNFWAFCNFLFLFFLVYYYYGILLACFTILMHDNKFEITYININIHTNIYIYIRVLDFMDFTIFF